MNPYLSQDVARFQIAERLRQAEQARLCRQVRTTRAPRRLRVSGWKAQWLSPWLAYPVRTA